MSQAFSDIAFTPAVRAMQTCMGSRKNYAQLDESDDRRDRLSRMEADFIGERDSFYQATVSETGWPYVQFRGGSAGFLKVLDEKTIGYADFRGNLQYISVGNFENNDRVSIILMDYANRRRLKILGRVLIVELAEDPDLVSQFESAHYRARVERAVIISVEGYDWNCPQHITPRFTEQEIFAVNAPLREELAALKARLVRPNETSLVAKPDTLLDGLGSGPLALVITGVRQLTPRVRAYELSAVDGGVLPAVEAGAHIDVPVRLPTDTGVATDIRSTRRYSITRVSEMGDRYEVAVQKDDNGGGGSVAVHRDYLLGLTLNCGMPGNDFPLHEGTQPAVLIAGGIGITPIYAMAMALMRQGRRFALHYAARSRREAAFAWNLQSLIGGAVTFYFGDAGQKLDVTSIMVNASADSIFYACGPNTLIEFVRKVAKELEIVENRIRVERFSTPSIRESGKPVRVTLQRSGNVIDVSASQSILDAVHAVGVDAPAACRTGNCGTCAVKVLRGEPDHRDMALSNAERTHAGLMCICVSRAKSSTLILDI